MTSLSAVISTNTGAKVAAKAALSALYPIALSAAITLGVAYPLLQPGFPIYMDNPMHVAQAYFMVDEMLPETKWITGWAEYLDAGIPVALYYSQFGFWLIALANLLLKIPVEVAYKMAMMGSYAFSGWALYKLFTPRFGGRAGTICCSLWLLQFQTVSGLASAFGGMWNQYLGLGFFFLLIGRLDSLYRRFTLATLAWAAALLGLIILNHPFVSFAAIIVFAIYFLATLARLQRGPTLRQKIAWLAIPLLGFGLSAFHLVPVLESSRWVPSPDWPGYRSAPLQIAYMLFLPAGQILRETPWLADRALVALSQVNESVFVAAAKLAFSNLPNIVLGVLSLWGIAYLAKSRAGDGEQRRLVSVMLCFAAISFFIAADYLLAVPVLRDVSFFKTLLAPRFVIYVRLGLLALAAYALWQPPATRHLGSRAVYNAAAAALILLAALGFNYTEPGRESMLTSSQLAGMADVERVWGWVRSNVDGSKTRVLYQETFDNMPSASPLSLSHIFGLSARYTGVDALGPDYDYPLYPAAKQVSAEGGKIFRTPIVDASPEFIAERMQTFNAQYVVAVEPKLSTKLSCSNIFAGEATFGDFTIFSIPSYNPTWFALEGGSGTVLSGVSKGHRKSVVVEGVGEGTRLLVKSAYHPYWRALVNGQPSEIERTDDYLLAVPLPAVEAVEVDLTYDAFSLPTTAVTTVSLVTILLLAVLSRRQSYQD